MWSSFLRQTNNNLRNLLNEDDAGNVLVVSQNKDDNDNDSNNQEHEQKIEEDHHPPDVVVEQKNEKEVVVAEEEGLFEDDDPKNDDNDMDNDGNNSNGWNDDDDNYDDDDENSSESDADEQHGEENRLLSTSSSSLNNSNNIVSNLVGNRFNYMGRVAEKFMKQVIVVAPHPPPSSDGDDDNDEDDEQENNNDNVVVVAAADGINDNGSVTMQEQQAEQQERQQQQHEETENVDSQKEDEDGKISDEVLEKQQETITVVPEFVVPEQEENKQFHLEKNQKDDELQQQQEQQEGWSENYDDDLIGEEEEDEKEDDEVRNEMQQQQERKVAINNNDEEHPTQHQLLIKIESAPLEEQVEEVASKDDVVINKNIINKNIIDEKMHDSTFDSTTNDNNNKNNDDDDDDDGWDDDNLDDLEMSERPPFKQQKQHNQENNDELVVQELVSSDEHQPTNTVTNNNNRNTDETEKMTRTEDTDQLVIAEPTAATDDASTPSIQVVVPVVQVAPPNPEHTSFSTLSDGQPMITSSNAYYGYRHINNNINNSNSNTNELNYIHPPVQILQPHPETPYDVKKEIQMDDDGDGWGNDTENVFEDLSSLHANDDPIIPVSTTSFDVVDVGGGRQHDGGDEQQQQLLDNSRLDDSRITSFTREAEQVEGSLDKVVCEIHQQEGEASDHHRRGHDDDDDVDPMNQPLVYSSDQYSNDDPEACDHLSLDELRHDQAVQHIQKEMQHIQQTQQLWPHQHQQQSVSGGGNLGAGGGGGITLGACPTDNNNIIIVSSSHHERTVDQTPRDIQNHPSFMSSPSQVSVVEDDPSLRVLAESEDLTRDTGNAEFEEEDVYDDENEFNFGPVVDQTPTKKNHHIKNLWERQDSLAVLPPVRDHGQLPAGDGSLTSDEDDDDGDDDDDDGAIDDNDSAGEISSHPPTLLNDFDYDFANALTPVVDHTPDDTYTIPNLQLPVLLTRGLSMGVCPSEGDTLDNTLEDHCDNSSDQDRDHITGQDDLDDNIHAFGPMVDAIPQTPAPTSSASRSGANSLAVNFATLEEDFQEDAAMDETYYGDSTVGGCETTSVGGGGSTLGVSTVNDGWGDEDLAFTADDEEEEEEKINTEGGIQVKKSEKKTTTFSLELNTIRRHVVDHTPSELASEPADIRRESVDPSLLVLASSVDLSVDTESEDVDIYEDENELAFGLKVVDHTPRLHVTPKSSTTNSLANSLAVQASVVKDGDSLADDDGLDQTSFGDLSVGRMNDVETNESLDKLGMLGIEKSSKVNNVDVALVDHTPSDIGSPMSKNYSYDPSVYVLQSEVNTRATCDADSTGENIMYGPVVDHTPRLMVDQTPETPELSAYQLRSDSVVVQVHDLDTVDETTFVGGSRNDDEEDDVDSGDEADMPAELRPDVGKLVDHVPTRSESRFGDGSTMVAADPSEVISEVDDLAPEEQFYQVVDLTPITRHSAAVSEPPSGAGSTAVFAPASVAADDLDEDPCAESQGDQQDQDDWSARNPTVNEAAAPNPQSGNDEPVALPVNEQLVDFLPPPHETVSNEAEDVTELTVGGAQSLIHTGDPSNFLENDPVEDDFGPVVDQLPISQPSIMPVLLSHASTTTQISASECQALEKDDGAEENTITDDASSTGRLSNVGRVKAKVVVDPLPQLISNKPADSIATVGRSQISEEEEDDASNKFGPVVDHLPVSRSSIAPSQGGSTVDALANVSEANSDDDDGEEGDGWDDDVDLDGSLGNVSEGQVLVSARKLLRQIGSTPIDQDRSISVRFDSSVNDSRSSESQNYHRTQYYNEPEIQHGMQLNNPSLQHEGDGWDDDTEVAGDDLHVNEKSFAEADTPPSTPYRRPVPDPVMMDTSQQFSIDLPAVGIQSSSTIEPNVPAFPGVGNLSNIHPFSLSQYSEQAERFPIQFVKILEDEKAKCRSLEDQLSIARSSLKETQMLTEVLVKEKESELRGTIDSLIQTREDLSKSNQQFLDDNACLRKQSEKLRNDISDYCKSIADLEQAVFDSKAKEYALEERIQSLQISLEASKSSAENSAAELVVKIETLQRDLATKTKQFNQLEITVTALQSAEEKALERARTVEDQSEELRLQVCSLEQQIRTFEDCDQATRQSISMEHEELEKRCEMLKSTIDQLQNHLSGLKGKQEKELQEQLKLLEKERNRVQGLEAALKQSDREKVNLREDLSRQRRLGMSTERVAHELMFVVQQRDDLQSKLKETQTSLTASQKTINGLRKEREEMEAKHASEISSLKQEVDRFKQLFSSKEKECEEAVSELTGLKNERDLHDAEFRQSISNLEAELRKEMLNSKRLSEEKDAAFAERGKMSEKYAQIEIKYANEIACINESFQTQYRGHDEEVHGLRGKISLLEDLAANSSRLQNESDKQLVVALEELETERARYVQMTSERDTLKVEVEEMLIQFGLMKEKLDLFEDEKGSPSPELQAKILELERENADLQKRGNELADVNNILETDIKSAKSAKDGLVTKIIALERELSLANAWKQENEMLQSNIRDQQTKLEGLDHKCRAQKEMITQLEGDMQTKSKEAAGRVLQLKESCSQLQNELVSLNEAIKAGESKENSYKDRIQDLESQLTEKKNMVTLLENSTVDNEAQLKESLARAEAMEQSQAELESVLESTRNDLRSSQQQLSEKSSMLDEYTKAISDLKLQLQESQTSIFRLEACVKAKDSDILAAGKRLVALESSCEDLRLQVSTSAKQLIKFEENDRSQLSEVESLRMNVQELGANLKEKEDYITLLQNNVGKLQARVNEVTANSKSEISEIINAFKVEADKYTSSLEDTKERLLSSEEEVIRLNKELNKIRSERVDDYIAKMKSDLKIRYLFSDSDIKILDLEVNKTEQQRELEMNQFLQRRKSIKENQANALRLIQKVQKFNASLKM